MNSAPSFTCSTTGFAFAGTENSHAPRFAVRAAQGQRPGRKPAQGDALGKPHPTDKALKGRDNVCRQRVRGTNVECTFFSATGKDDFYVPEKFAKLWGKGR